MFGGQAFHSAFGAHWHEHGGGHLAMGQGHYTGSAVLVLSDEGVGQWGQQLGFELLRGLVVMLNGLHCES